ncbi:unnamed protein product [Tuber aestivum]|uniref:DUF6594 domain-containing protein n=1 Tax=Tuber aestivum TaxID=59557 RepID=A0A292PNJ3_9PEZI|nr:unnamed protein product [Tuber aestivum]
MSPSPDRTQMEGHPTTPPFPPASPAYLSAPQLTSPYHAGGGGGSPQYLPPPSPRSSHTYHPAYQPTDHTNGFTSASSPFPGYGGGSGGEGNRHPSNSSRSARASTPCLAAPGYSLEEHKDFREIADYMSGEGDCILVRRFGALRFRDMLCKQAQVMEVEIQLAEEDGKVLQGGGDIEMVKRLMRKLDTKLKAYDDALERCHRTYTMPPPSTRSLSKTNTWLNTRGFQHRVPELFQDDMITLDQALVTDGLMTRFAALIARVVFKKEVSRRAGVSQIPAHRPILVARALIALIAPVILLVPVVLLCYLKALWKQIVVVVMATVTSSFAMMVAKAGNAEVFMATSAYAAVMVVFLGTVANVGGGKG